MLGVYEVEGVFKPGDHLVEWCSRIQAFDKTATVSSRYHLKTTVVLGFIAWQMYCVENKYTEGLFIGYTQDLGAYHLKRLKRYIAAIPEYFDDFEDATNAESILDYKRGEQEFSCMPQGMLSFKRGQHPDFVICDDILRDPEVKLDISQLLKIESIFIEQIMPMPKRYLHVVGTPQDEADLFARLESMSMFNCKRYPAWINRAKEIALWPEEWPASKLKEYEISMRERSFNKEFMCRPVRSEEGYFTTEEVDGVINERLKNYGYSRKCKTDKYCYGGFDIGKKRHPSHIPLFAEDRKGRLVQVASIWLDGVDYTKQLDIIKWLSDNYTIQLIYYDDTRAEMEGFNERGELPPEMEGINFTQKKKFEMAAQLEKEIKNKTIVLLKDERQKRQILNCDNDLKSMQTDEGHGDAFWSVALAVSAARVAMPNIR